MTETGFYDAGTCQACQCHLTLVQRHSDREVIGHDQKCKVKSDPW